MKETKLKIMIIEDETCIRESLTWFLEDLGHEVVSGEEPINCDVYKGHNCSRNVSCTDALIIDQHLLGLKGLDFIVDLKERGCKGITANTLLMSGDTTSIDIDKASDLGVTVVQKPMPFEYLEEWLSRVNKSD